MTYLEVLLILAQHLVGTMAKWDVALLPVSWRPASHCRDRPIQPTLLLLSWKTSPSSIH